MKRKKKNSKKTFAPVIRVIEQDLRGEQGMDVVAESLIKLLDNKVSAELQSIFWELLLGFSRAMQLEIADDLLDFAHGHVVHTTGCCSVDAVLKTCYAWIAEEQGFKLNI